MLISTTLKHHPLFIIDQPPKLDENYIGWEDLRQHIELEKIIHNDTNR